MTKPKGLPHDDVVRWRALNDLLLQDVGWPEEGKERFGDLEERILGQKIFENNGVKPMWTPLPDGSENITRTFYVKSASQAQVKQHTVILNFVLEPSGKYSLAEGKFAEHVCDDMAYHRLIYRRVPRVWGPCQHIIAAIYFAQQQDYYDPEYRWGVWPKDFVELCDKLDIYFKGDFTSVFRRQIKYTLNAILFGNEEIIKRFEGEPPMCDLFFKQKEEYKVNILAKPAEDGNALLEIRYGPKSRASVATKVPYANFIRKV